MKTGCAISLIFLAVGYFVGHSLIRGTEIQDQYWVPFVYGIGAMLVFLNVWGILQALKKKSAAGRPASEWKTGDLVVLSGTVHAKGRALIAPFSKQPAVMVEYAIQSGDEKEEGHSANQYFGFIATPCTLRSAQGSHSLLGFQILPDFSKQMLFQQTAFPNAVDFVRQTKFKPLADNPLKIASEMLGVIDDTDGDVQANYAAPNANFLEMMEAQQGDNLKGLDPFRGFTLEEKLISNGAEVAISGTFQADTNSIDIGNPMKNLDHSLSLGAAAVSSNRPLITSLLMTLFFGAALGGATYFLMSLAKR